MFADDIVICSESKEQVERGLERWRYALDRRGMKVSRSKTECMCVNERGDGEMVLLQGVEVPKVKEFSYLGSTVQYNGVCGSEVKRRVQAGWNNWRRVSGVICDRRFSTCAKGKVYKMVVRPAAWWWNEEVAAIIDIKKTKCKEWHKAKGSLEEESKHKEYIEAKRAAKKAVAKTQQKEREQFAEMLDTKEGQRELYLE